MSDRLVNYMLPYTYTCVEVPYVPKKCFFNLHLLNWSTNDQMNSHAVITKVNSSWHGCKGNTNSNKYCHFCSYSQCQECCLMTYFVFESLSTLLELNLGAFRRRKRGLKMLWLPCSFRGSFKRDLSGCSKHKLQWNCTVFEIHFTVSVK